MAQLMQNQGVIAANYPAHARLATLEYNLKHLGISNVVTSAVGARISRYDVSSRGCRSTLRAREREIITGIKQGRMQHVRRATGTPTDLPRVQKQLLLRGFDLLAPGGSLIHATCTYNPGENEAVVQELLEQRPATIQPITLPAPHSPGLLQWKEYTYDARMQHCWRLYPHQTGSVGFFVASIRAGAAP